MARLNDAILQEAESLKSEAIPVDKRCSGYRNALVLVLMVQLAPQLWFLVLSEIGVG